MRGLYFSTNNNSYFYDDETGVVHATSMPENTSGRSPIVYGERRYHHIACNDLSSLYKQLPSSMLILIVTEDCNFRCKYCVYSGVYDNQRKHNSSVMSLETAHKAVENYLAFLDRLRKNNLNISPVIGFYGGEPLLNFDLIRYVVTLTDSRYPGKTRYSITTNASLLTPDIIDFFVSHNFTLTISLNGGKDENDRNRVFANGTGTYEIIMGKIAYIKHHYPSFFSERLIISSVYDSGTNLEEFNRFFEAPMWKEIPLIVMPVSMLFSEWYEQYGSQKNRAMRETLLAWQDLYYNHLVSDEHISKLEKSLFASQVLRILLRRTETLPLFTPFTNTCIPGTKVAVAPNGNLFCCEKMNYSRPIGTAENWIDEEFVLKLINDYNSGLGPQCINCPISRVCPICYSQVFDANGNVCPPSKRTCDNYIKSVRDTFEKIYCLMELGITNIKLVKKIRSHQPKAPL